MLGINMTAEDWYEKFQNTKWECDQLRKRVKELEAEVDEWKQMSLLNADQAEKNAGYKTAHDIHMIVCDFEHIKRETQLAKKDEALGAITKILKRGQAYDIGKQALAKQKKEE